MSDNSIAEMSDSTINISSNDDESIGSSQNGLKDGSHVRDALESALSEINESELGAFAVSGLAPNLPYPGLEVKSIGILSLPLPDCQKEKLIAQCEQAPYGKGTETVLDNNVRRTWQLNPSEFKINNTLFKSGVNDLVAKISKEMGVRGNVRAFVYKLLLYTVGGHFKLHQDTEKEEGMFGTLVIQFPSKYEGGEMSVHFNNDVHSIQYKDTEFTSSFCSFYADCSHEVKEITSGSRLVLVYSLCWDGSGNIPVPTTGEQSRKVADLLTNYDEATDGSQFVWALRHMYSDNSLNQGQKALKGKDCLVIGTLRKANEVLEAEKRYDFYFVLAKRTETKHGHCSAEGDCGGTRFDSDGDCDLEEGDEILKNWMDLNGNHLKFGEKFIIDLDEDLINYDGDPESFWGESKEAHCSGPTGNAGANLELQYNRYIVFAVPVRKSVDMFCSAGLSSAASYVNSKISKSLDENNPEIAREWLSKLISNCATNIQDVESGCMNTVLKNLVRLNSEDLAKEFFLILSKQFEAKKSYYERNDPWPECIGFGSENQLEYMYALLWHFGIDVLEDCLLKIVENCENPKKLGGIATVLTSKTLEDLKKKIPKQSMKQLVDNSNNSFPYNISENVISAKLAEICAGNLVVAFNKYKFKPSNDWVILNLLEMLLTFQNCSEQLKTILNMASISSNLGLVIFLLGGLATRGVSSFNKAQLNDLMVKLVLGFEKNAISENYVNAAGFVLTHMEDVTVKERLVNAILANNRGNFLSKLIKSFVFVNDKHWDILVAKQYSVLVKKTIVGEPKFSWCQPYAKVSSYPEVQEFLRGPRQSENFSFFNDLKHGRNWACKYFGSGSVWQSYGSTFETAKQSYMATAEASGRGRDTWVQVKKNKAYHDIIIKEYHQNLKELEMLEILYPLLKKNIYAPKRPGIENSGQLSSKFART